MSPITLAAQLPYAGFQAGYFDDDIINVPQAQDSIVYAGHTLLDEELGLINAYDPLPLRDEIALAREHNPALIMSRKRAAIKMEALDNGLGRLQGSAEFLAASATRLYDDASAREASLRREHRARLFGDDSPHCAMRAATGYAPAPVKARYAAAPPGAPRTVYNATPIARVPTPAAVPEHNHDHDGPRFHLNYDGLHPTETLLCAEAAVPCIDPILLDAAAWHTDYRRDGLEALVGSSYVFPLSNIPVSPAPAPKKRAAVSKKVSKVVKVVKEKKTSVKDKKVAEMCAKPVTIGSILRRRNSLAARGNTLF